MLEKEKRAAQYIRMSTDMQRYAIENQCAAIALYAAARGIAIVRSYIDAARSGLRIEKRSALKGKRFSDPTALTALIIWRIERDRG